MSCCEVLPPSCGASASDQESATEPGDRYPPVKEVAFSGSIHAKDEEQVAGGISSVSLYLAMRVCEEGAVSAVSGTKGAAGLMDGVEAS